MENLILAWRKARKGKTKKNYVIEFEKDLERNLSDLSFELKSLTYKPKELVNFILRDPKTRKISKSDFRDRIVHHAIILVIGYIFEKGFIYDSCANQIGKGNLFALNRLNRYMRKVTNNFTNLAFCLKCDIKHYFEEVDHEIIISILRRKIKDENVIWLIRLVLYNGTFQSGGGGEQKKESLLGNCPPRFFQNFFFKKFYFFLKYFLKKKF